MSVCLASFLLQEMSRSLANISINFCHTDVHDEPGCVTSPACQNRQALPSSYCG